MNLFLEHSRTNITTIKKAWEEFIETGDVSNSRPRSVIVDSWRASRQKGISPTIERAPAALETAELDIKLNRDDLGKVGKPVLDRIAPNTHNTKHVIVMADANGQIIYSVGHQQIQSKLEKINFMPGGNWSIDEVGPNGVGTPIALDSPELIYGSEHYCQAWQPWVCYGAPIHDNSGNVIGCIDITGPAGDLSQQTMSLAMSLSYSVESGLNLISLQKREYLRSVFQQRKSAIHSDLMLLIDDLGFVVDHNPTALTLLGIDSTTIQTTTLARSLPRFWEKLATSLPETATATVLDYRPCEDSTDLTMAVEPVFFSGSLAGCIIILNNTLEHIAATDHHQMDLAQVDKIDLRTQGDQIIRDAVATANGNISKAARLLGINRTTIYRRLELLNKQ